MYILLRCHHQNDSCIKMDSDESHLNVSLIVRDKVTRRWPQTTTFEEKGELHGCICKHNTNTHTHHKPRHVCTHTHTNTHTHTHTTNPDMYTNKHTHTHTHMYTNKHTQSHTHAQTHT